VLVVTGPSGVGKGTLIRSLQERLPGLELSVSATTRAPRPGETHGRHYWFLSPEEFDARLRAGEFLEHATYAGHRYGTLRSEVERAVARPPDGGGDIAGLVLEIELEGARQVRRALPEAVQVFIAPPSLEALRSRLVGRGADAPDQIEDRLAVARRELAAREEFRHVIVNDRLEDAVEELTDLVARVWGRPGKGARP
jgi:guanylate kinase